MATGDKTKQFDCVQFMREAREQISREISGLDHDQLVQWLASLEYSDPALARLARKFREDQAAADANCAANGIEPLPAHRTAQSRKEATDMTNWDTCPAVEQTPAGPAAPGSSPELGSRSMRCTRTSPAAPRSTSSSSGSRRQTRPRCEASWSTKRRRCGRTWHVEAGVRPRDAITAAARRRTATHRSAGSAPTP